MEVVINKCYGGFELSDECAIALGAILVEWPGMKGIYYHRFPKGECDTDFRTNPRLIALIKEKGSEWCSGPYARLKVVTVPDDVNWEITDYDGVETIEEVHNSWG